jgi:hypothetical protein
MGAVGGRNPLGKEYKRFHPDQSGDSDTVYRAFRNGFGKTKKGILEKRKKRLDLSVRACIL